MAPDNPHPLERFTNRVDDYVRYRPRYPAELIGFLAGRFDLGAGPPVADVGAGTGIFTRQLLDAGARVFAVEPNEAMRRAAEAALAGRPGFVSVGGTAEQTTLAPRSVVLVTCAQAFHWFDPARTRAEFIRILRPEGAAALVWNTSVAGGSDLAAGFEAIKSRFGTDYQRIRHENIPPERFDAFFGRGAWEKRQFENHQLLDWDGFRGRLLSSSYAPTAGDPRHGPMLAELSDLFRRCERAGSVRLDYRTELFLGRFAG
jgi:SAM-dependent methyltransferase